MTFHGNVIIPTDELHHFSEGSTVYHQPVADCTMFFNISTTDADSSSFRGAFRGDSVEIRRSSPK